MCSWRCCCCCVGPGRIELAVDRVRTGCSAPELKTRWAACEGAEDRTRIPRGKSPGSRPVELRPPLSPVSCRCVSAWPWALDLSCVGNEKGRLGVVSVGGLVCPFGGMGGRLRRISRVRKADLLHALLAHAPLRFRGRGRDGEGADGVAMPGHERHRSPSSPRKETQAIFSGLSQARSHCDIDTVDRSVAPWTP
jgi:hypothetical protein